MDHTGGVGMAEATAVDRMERQNAKARRLLDVAASPDIHYLNGVTAEDLMAAYDAEIASRGIPPTDIPEYRASRLSLCEGTLRRLAEREVKP